MDSTILTIKYYDLKHEDYVNGTQNIDFFALQNMFTSYIKRGGKILDLGCGSGRDSKAFIEKGFDIVALDGSIEMCHTASALIGKKVIFSTFQDYEPKDKFDGIWACASLLHLEKDEIISVMQKLTGALNAGGCFYVSFKYGSFYGERNGRYFTDMNEESFQRLIENVPSLNVVQQFVSSDVRPDRKEEKWLNVFMVKGN